MALPCGFTVSSRKSGKDESGSGDKKTTMIRKRSMSIRKMEITRLGRSGKDSLFYS